MPSLWRLVGLWPPVAKYAFAVTSASGDFISAAEGSAFKCCAGLGFNYFGAALEGRPRMRMNHGWSKY